MAAYDCVKGKSTNGGSITLSVGFEHTQNELRCLAISHVKDEYQWKVVDAGKLTAAGSVYTLAYPFSTAGQPWSLYIWRKTSRTDDVEFTGDRIPIEAIITKLVELSDKADETAHEAERAVRTPECDGDAFLPPKDVRADEIMGFDSEGRPAVGKNVKAVKEIYNAIKAYQITIPANAIVFITWEKFCSLETLAENTFYYITDRTILDVSNEITEAVNTHDASEAAHAVLFSSVESKLDTMQSTIDTLTETVTNADAVAQAASETAATAITEAIEAKEAKADHAEDSLYGTVQLNDVVKKKIWSGNNKYWFNFNEGTRTLNMEQKPIHGLQKFTWDNDQSLTFPALSAGETRTIATKNDVNVAKEELTATIEALTARVAALEGNEGNSEETTSETTTE